MSSHIRLTFLEWQTMTLINQTLQSWEEFTSGWLDSYYIYTPVPAMTLGFMIIIGMLLLAMHRMAAWIANLEMTLKSAVVRVQ